MVSLHPAGGHELRGHGRLVPRDLVVLIVHLGPPEILAIEPVVLDRVRGCVDGGPAEKGLFSKSIKGQNGKKWLPVWLSGGCPITVAITLPLR